MGTCPKSLEPSVIDYRGLLPTRAGVAPYRTRPLSQIIGVDVHYTASNPSVSVEAIARYQTGPSSQEAFPAIAYTDMVLEDGTIAWCHNLAVRTWHNGAPGHNDTRIGLCYVGNVEPNEKQLAAMRWRIAYYEQALERVLIVEGHKDSHPTACPGPKWDEWKGLLR